MCVAHFAHVFATCFTSCIFISELEYVDTFMHSDNELSYAVMTKYIMYFILYILMVQYMYNKFQCVGEVYWHFRCKDDLSEQDICSY